MAYRNQNNSSGGGFSGMFGDSMQNMLGNQTSQTSSRTAPMARQSFNPFQAFASRFGQGGQGMDWLSQFGMQSRPAGAPRGRAGGGMAPGTQPAQPPQQPPQLPSWQTTPITPYNQAGPMNYANPILQQMGQLGMKIPSAPPMNPFSYQTPPGMQSTGWIYN